MVEVGLEFAFEMKIFLSGRQHVEENALGLRRGCVTVKGGEIYGPMLQGEVIPDTGGDYPVIQPDGTAVFDARYLLKASDGTNIMIQNRGYRHGPKEVLDAILRHEEVDPDNLYFRLFPRFEVPAASPHAWMSRSVFVGSGQRRADHSIFSYFRVT